MLFKPELRQKIIQDEKTQTRRPQKVGDMLVIVDGKKTVHDGNNRIKMQVGRTYSVQYGYGKPCAWWHPEWCKELDYETYLDILSPINKDVDLLGMFYKKLCIKVVDIWQEHVAEISHGDSVMEGFQNPFEFWQVWCGFYDKTALNHINSIEYPVLKLGEIRDYLQTRPTHLYRAFAYDFRIA